MVIILKIILSRMVYVVCMVKHYDYSMTSYNFIGIIAILKYNVMNKWEAIKKWKQLLWQIILYYTFNCILYNAYKCRLERPYIYIVDWVGKVNERQMDFSIAGWLAGIYQFSVSLWSHPHARRSKVNFLGCKNVIRFSYIIVLYIIIITFRF